MNTINLNLGELEGKTQKKTRVDLPHFYGKENVETYLD